MTRSRVSPCSFLRRSTGVALVALVLVLAVITGAMAADGDEHWSRQFPKPAQVSQMTAATGMADGVGSPSVRQIKWHDGKLWFAGVWEAGIDARISAKGSPTSPGTSGPGRRKPATKLWPSSTPHREASDPTELSTTSSFCPMAG